MRLFFIDLELKSVRLEASSSRSGFVNSSPQLVQINSALISVQSRMQIRMAVRQRNLSRCYPSPASMPGPFVLFW